MNGTNERDDDGNKHTMIQFIAPVVEGWRMVVACDATASVDCAGRFETVQPTADACHRALAEAGWKRQIEIGKNLNGDVCSTCHDRP
jgi:hypothetical protein